MKSIRNIKVLINYTDESTGEIIEKYLEEFPDIEVAERTTNLKNAFEFVRTSKPDVMIVGVEPPCMREMEFIKITSLQYKLPILVVTASSNKGRLIALQALDAGALDFTVKPTTNNILLGLGDMTTELAEKIRIASHANMNSLNNHIFQDSNPANFSFAEPDIRQETHEGETNKKIVAIAGGMGSISAFKQVLNGIKSKFPAIIFLGNLPSGFTKTLADTLNQIYPFQVQEAGTGIELAGNTVYIAPGDLHTKLVIQDEIPKIVCYHGEKLNNSRPSADILMQSLAETMGENGMGIILTGEGKDGAYGMKALKSSGGILITQDKESSLLFEMPDSVGDTFTESRKAGLRQIAEEIGKFL